MRHHPISPITKPMQYRAIGIARGKYVPNEISQLTKGTICTEDGTRIEAVVLGRLLNLMRRRLDLDKPHLWITYPRCRENNKLHLQMVGVWEPRTFVHSDIVISSKREDDHLPEGEDYFSIRGEVIYICPSTAMFVVQVRQARRLDGKYLGPFKLQINGNISLFTLHHFLALDLRRQDQMLILERYEIIGIP
uniref:Uncharacterized protein n=1 Tax=Paulinella chromatophora TaxID=39717 RepID=B1X3F7_PAUCH|nr:hypothetical protein PCC_0014 [Paulinella chromatophora]ACB42476.1 hypothetical protein PCC_0014 [Paulinella chromatophora]